MGNELNNQIDNQQLSPEENPIQAFASFNELQMSYLNTNYPNGLNTFTNFTIPRDYINQVKKAKELRNYSIVNKLIKIRNDYSLPIKEFKCKTKRQQKFYNEIVLPLVQRYARQFIVELYTVGEIFSHYGFKNDKKTPMFIRLESAEDIIPISALGFEIFEVKISSDLKSQIKKLQKQKAIDKLPEYLRNIINNEGHIQDKIILDNTSMHRIAEEKQDYENRVKPPILNIMKQLVLREFLIDLDHMTSFGSQKTSIVHVKCGTDQKPILDEKLLKAIHDTITNRPPSQAIITTRGDISISAVDSKISEILDPKKFEQVNSDILDYFGLPTVFIPSRSEGINNTTVVISLKSFEQSIETDRQIFQEFLNTFFTEINKRNGFTEIPKTIYKHTNIKDDKSFIAELEFLFEKGIISFYDLCPIFNYDIDEQLESKRKALENRKLVSPYFENSQGLLSPIDPIVEGNNNNTTINNK